MECGEGSDCASVNLLWPWLVDIATAQACLDMANRDLAVIGGNCPRQDRGRVALHHHPIRLFFIKHFANFEQSTCGQRIEGLARLHQIEIVVRDDAGDIEHLVQHFAMLS